MEKSDRPALKARAERYRELAAEVLRLKERAGSQEIHAACVNLAAGWKSLADKIETRLDHKPPADGASEIAHGGSDGALADGENPRKRAASDR